MMRILDSLKNLACLPYTAGKPLAVGTVMTSLGIGATALSCLTLGKCKAINKAADWTGYSRRAIPEMIERTIQVIHPELTISDFKQREEPLLSGLVRNGSKFLVDSFAWRKRTFFEVDVDRPFSFTTKEKYVIDDTRYILLRVIAIIEVVALLTARITDFAIGVIMLLGQVFEGFSDSEYNYEMASCLNLLASIDDIARGLRGVVNPYQFIN